MSQIKNGAETKKPANWLVNSAYKCLLIEGLF